MLFNPRTEHGTLPHLIAWMERQPADEWYDYRVSAICLAGKYNADIGRKYSLTKVIANIFADRKCFDAVLEDIAQGDGKVDSWTYGKALKRARALVTD